MLRRTVLIALPVLALAVVVGYPTTAWGAPPLTGSVTCNPIAGSGFFNHPITTTGTATHLSIHFTGTLSGCNGTPVTIGNTTYSVTGGTMTASGHFIRSGGHVNKCSNFEGPYPSSTPSDTLAGLHIRIHWTTNPSHSWTPTRITYTGGFESLLYPNLNQSSPGPPYTGLNLFVVSPVNGGISTTSVTGSYAGTGAVTNMMIRIPSGSSATGCPLGPAFTFNGVAIALP